MHHDLEHLIALQRLDSAASEARRRIAEAPDRERLFADRLDAARERVAGAKARLADSQAARRVIEKDVAVQQGRLSKYRDQLMSVKTNVEYQAMQKEIEFAQTEVKALEDRELERMLEADEYAATLKQAEAALRSEEQAVEADRQELATTLAEQNAQVAQLTRERTTLVASLGPQVLATFELVSSRRNGVAVAEARDGICTICHVRLRPQVFNNVRRNDQIIQCDSCLRILYFVPSAPAAPADAVGQSAS
jgi:predicted  nucleic acid-binding Zn-ribbon protein